MCYQNANDALKHHNSTDDYYRYLCGMLITDGAKALADDFQCYWFIDVVCSYQGGLKEHSFQVWTLKRYEETTVAVVTCTDGNDNVLCKQDIPFTDFKPLGATIWVEGNVVLLPSEH